MYIRRLVGQTLRLKSRTIFVLPRQIWLALSVPAFLIAFGTVGYVVLEGWHWFDALYMTVMMITTVGYSDETRHTTTVGRAFTIFLTLGGVFTLFYSASELIRFSSAAKSTPPWENSAWSRAWPV